MLSGRCAVQYAGWDDPAKLACDSCCQPQVPVAGGLQEDFLNQLTQTLDLDSAFSDRVRRLQPAYQVLIGICFLDAARFIPALELAQQRVHALEPGVSDPQSLN